MWSNKPLKTWRIRFESAPLPCTLPSGANYSQLLLESIPRPAIESQPNLSESIVFCFVFFDSHKTEASSGPEWRHKWNRKRSNSVKSKLNAVPDYLADASAIVSPTIRLYPVLLPALDWKWLESLMIITALNAMPIMIIIMFKILCETLIRCCWFLTLPHTRLNCDCETGEHVKHAVPLNCTTHMNNFGLNEP